MSARNKKLAKNNPPADAPRPATRSVTNSVNSPNDTHVSESPANTPANTKQKGKPRTGMLHSQSPTYCSSAAEKRKRSDTTAAADKRAQTKPKKGKSGGDINSGTTADTTTEPAEQGRRFCNKSLSFLQIVAAANQPIVLGKATRRKVLPRPELSLDSASEEGDSEAGSLLGFFEKMNTTDCVTDGNESHSDSDDNVMSLPTAENLLEEVSLPPCGIAEKRQRFNCCPMPVKMVTGGQTNNENTDDIGHVADLGPTVGYG